MPNSYLIWSNEHRGWWLPNSNGYTADIKLAGIYCRDEALDIVRDATRFQWGDGVPNELPVSTDDLPDDARVLLGLA